MRFSHGFAAHNTTHPMKKETRHFLMLCGLIGGGVILSSCVIGEGLNALANTGSGTFERMAKQKQVERVARDWCLTIRGSQVIPIYPIDEDIQPGDTYIVDTPIEQLKSFWNKHGYLPIDHRFGRLQPSGYSKYYLGGGYGVQSGTVVPRHWQFPDRTRTTIIPQDTLDLNDSPTGDEAAIHTQKAAAEKARQAVQEQVLADTDWPRAPRAGFPTYTFTIKRGESFNGALPVQGVPVMLGALGAREITGSITLSDAYTYGIDEPSIRDDLYRWARQSNIKTYLANYVIPKEANSCVKQKFNYLRVVTRVYLVRSVDIAMSNTEASAWKLSGGAPKDVPSPTPAGDNTNIEQQTKLLAALEAGLGTHSLVTSTPTPYTPPSPNIAAPTPAATPTPAPATPAPATPAPAAPAAGAAGATPAPATPKPKSKPKTPDELAAEAQKRQLAQQNQRLDFQEQQLGLQERQQGLDQRRTALLQQAQQREFNVKAYKNALARAGMSDQFGGYVVPGGTLKVTSSTGKTISMHETFGRPLVVGYHALEFAILEGGQLSDRPVSTYKRMDFNQEPSYTPILAAFTPASDVLQKWVLKSTKNRDELERWLKQQQIETNAALFTVDARYEKDVWRFAREKGLVH